MIIKWAPVMLRFTVGVLLLCYLSATICCCDVRAQSSEVQPLGTNLAEVTDYSGQLPFVNMVLSSRSWLTQCRVDTDPGCSSSIAFDTGEAAALDLDSDGWVRSLPAANAAPIFTSVATFWDVPRDFPSGLFVVLYDGDGLLEYELGASRNDSRSRPGREIIQIDPSRGGVLLRIARTNPNNYVRNIQMVSEAEESRLNNTTFRQQFIDRLRPYEALRFMDWMRTNNSIVSTWSNRSHKADVRYSTEKGVPAEIMIELANTTGKNPWFTMPHQSTNDYLESFASLTKSLLDESLSVLVEYSNEAWNPLFSQGAFMERNGELEWSTSQASGFTKRINWYGKRSAEMCQIWKRVFADAPHRVTCIVASQAANSWTATEALNCPLWSEGPCSRYGAAALAIAPYFGDYLGQEDAAQEVASWSRERDGGLANIFSELQGGGQLSRGPSKGALSQSFAWTDENMEVARERGLQLLAYEGGQHLVGVGSASENHRLTTLFTSANRDPRMQNVYSSYLNGWRSRGGGLFMHFTDISEYSKFGSWGALEGSHDTSSPKYDALLSYVGKDPLAPSTPIPPRGEQTLLSVVVRGAGRVVSEPQGIECGTACRALYSTNRRVTLTARAARGASFTRWLGACRHSRKNCRVVMKRNMRVSALFRRL